MNVAYTNGEEQNTAQGKKLFTEFAAVAKGIGFTLAAYATCKDMVSEFGKAQENRSVSTAEPGELAIPKLNSHDALGLGMGFATAVVLYTGRHEIKKAFVYGVKGLQKVSKHTASFATVAIDDLRNYTKENVAEDRENPNKPTFFNKINNLMGRSGR